VINDADNNDDYSAGDTWSETYSNCNVEGLVLNGTASADVRSATLTSIEIGISINQLSYGSGTLHGAGTLAVSVNGLVSTATLALSSMSLAVSGSETLTMWHATVLSYDESTGVSTSALDGPVALGSDSYWFGQTTAFTVPAGKNVPRSGTLAITDKDGDRILVVGTDAGLRYDFYKVGSATPDATQPGLPAD